MSYRGFLILALIAMTVVSGVVALIYVRYLWFVTENGTLIKGWSALWSAWPLYLAIGLMLSLAFSLAFSWGLESAFREDKARWERRQEQQAEQDKSRLAAERGKLEEERGRISQLEFDLRAKERQAEKQLASARQLTDEAQSKMTEAVLTVSEIKAKMRHKEGYQQRYKRKLAKLNSE